MPVVRPFDAVCHRAHGAAFHAMVAPSGGSAEPSAPVMSCSFPPVRS